MKNVRKADRAVKERYLINRRGVFHKDKEVEDFVPTPRRELPHKKDVAAVAMERSEDVMVLVVVLGVYWR